MRGDSCLGLPTKGNSHLLFTCEKGYVATQVADTNAGGGVCCHHSKFISYPHVFFSPKFSYFLHQSFNFFSFTFLCCDDIEYILDTNFVLYTKLYVINVISTFYKHNNKKELIRFLLKINDKLYTIKVAILCYIHNYLQQLQI